jgi:hypothetical protein
MIYRFVLLSLHTWVVHLIHFIDDRVLSPYFGLFHRLTCFNLLICVRYDTFLNRIGMYSEQKTTIVLCLKRLVIYIHMHQKLICHCQLYKCTGSMALGERNRNRTGMMYGLYCSHVVWTMCG